MESLLCFVGVFLKNILNKFKNCPQYIWKVRSKKLNVFLKLSNESQNITKKDMPYNMTYLMFFYYLIVVSCLYIKAG